jgi:hypothetical protein
MCSIDFGEHFLFFNKIEKIEEKKTKTKQKLMTVT